MRVIHLMAASILLAACAAQAAPDELLLGRELGYPVGTRSTSWTDESTRVGMFTHLASLWPHGTLKKSETPSSLRKMAIEPVIDYSYEGKTYSVDDYLQHQRVMGLLIIKNGEILAERYQYDRNADDRFVSNSMAKSITSLGIGLALEEGKIASLDDKVARYVPELNGFAYGEISINDLLRMSSGLKFVEEYDGKDDSKRFFKLVGTKGSIAALQAFGGTGEKPEMRFHYASINSAALGLVLAKATGKTLSAYLDEKLWRPMGAEADATWVYDAQGSERASGHFNATLRDYGRLGILLANDGAADGRQILPKSYLLQATDWHRQPEAFAPRHATPFYGYGYQFWIFPGQKRRFALLGIYGQVIFVDPASKTVLVQTAAAHNAKISRESMAAELNALWTGVLAQRAR